MQLFPIRTTRQEWKIPVYSQHTCSEMCKHVFNLIGGDDPYIITTENDTFVNERCSNYGKLYSTAIHLFSYDISRPRGVLGDLYAPDTVVIPDKEFTVHITYPLSVVSNIDVRSDSPITMRVLLQLIKDVYINIYHTEEQTTPITTFNLQKQCTNCTSIQPRDFLTPVDKPADTMCGICYSEYTDADAVSKCPCNHEFHTMCLTAWMEHEDRVMKSCPMCRASICKCTSCGNTGIVHYEYVGRILPAELRENGYRNATTGIYGISDIDLEELEIESMVYRRNTRTLYLIM